MAKPLANGYPIGAVLVRDAVAEVMSAGASRPTVLRAARGRCETPDAQLS